MMNSATPSDGARRDRCCEPGVLDDIACRATGIEKQAAYNAEHAQELRKAQDDYAAARARYTKARHDAAPLVAKARADLDELVKGTRCLLDRDDRECLERAFAHVAERLDRCGLHDGCCCGEDELDDAVEHCDPEEVPGRRARLERQVAEAAECFRRLIAEPGEAPPPAPASSTDGASADTTATTPLAAAPAASATASASAAPASGGTGTTGDFDGDDADGAETVVALPERVAALQAEIHTIAAALHSGTADPTMLYAEVLVAQRHLDTVWRGFANVNAYVECLCRCLTRLVTGHAAISVLVRKDAVHVCYRETWRKACRRLEEETAAEVVAEYLRICCEDDEDCEVDGHDDEDDGDEDDGDEDEDDEDDGYRDGVRHGDGEGHRRPHGRDEQPDVEVDVRVRVEDDDDDDRRPRRRRPRERRPEPVTEERPQPRPRGPRPRRPYTDDSGGYRAP